jgi:hypothetical protein
MRPSRPIDFTLELHIASLEPVLKWRVDWAIEIEVNALRLSGTHKLVDPENWYVFTKQLHEHAHEAWAMVVVTLIIGSTGQAVSYFMQ